MCTENPAELAWFMGIDEKSLRAGPKPDDMDLVECHEDWSHNGTPAWVCKEDDANAKEPRPQGKFNPLQRLTAGVLGAKEE